jgi:hypothetical protein
MRLEFEVETRLPPEQIYAFFKTPADWPRLFPAFGEATVRDDGLYRVPMHRSPIPLVAGNTTNEPGRKVAWDLVGFWKGDGEVRFEATAAGTRVTGHEEISLPRLLGLGSLLERWAEPRVAAVWEGGWRRLRRMDPSS